MSRHFTQPRVVAITPDAARRPAWLRWRGRRERVQICNEWRVEGAWWQAQTAARVYYTLLTKSGDALVVFQDEGDGRWYLEGVVD